MAKKKLQKQIEKVWISVMYDDAYSAEFDDAETIAGLESGKFSPYGIVAHVDTLIPLGDHWISHEVRSEGLWGVFLGSNIGSNKRDVQEIAEEQLDEVRAILKELGFSNQLISKSLKKYKINWP